jgi:hypothetical protein
MRLFWIIGILGILFFIIGIMGANKAEVVTKEVKCFDKFSNEIVGQICLEDELQEGTWTIWLVIGLIALLISGIVFGWEMQQ